MDLQTFKSKIAKWIIDNDLNIEMTNAGETYDNGLQLWSLSILPVGEGKIPYPNQLLIPYMKEILTNSLELEGFNLYTVYHIYAVTSAYKREEWQIQWLFRV